MIFVGESMSQPRVKAAMTLVVRLIARSVLVRLEVSNMTAHMQVFKESLLLVLTLWDVL